MILIKAPEDTQSLRGREKHKNDNESSPRYILPNWKARDGLIAFLTEATGATVHVQKGQQRQRSTWSNQLPRHSPTTTETIGSKRALPPSTSTCWLSISGTDHLPKVRKPKQPSNRTGSRSSRHKLPARSAILLPFSSLERRDRGPLFAC